MNKFILLCFLFSHLIGFETTAQNSTEGWSILYGKNQFAAQDIPTSLSEKQTRLASRPPIEVNCMTIAPDGGWVIAYLSSGLPYLSWDGTHKDFMQILHPINDDGSTIQQITFSPLAAWDLQSWVILYDDNDANWKNIPNNLIKTILDLNKQKRKIKSIGLAINGGWILVADNNEVFSELVPNNLLTQIKTLQSKQNNIKFISFNLDNGWIILYDKNGATWDNISSPLIEKIQKLQKADEEIRGVSFYTIKGKI